MSWTFDKITGMLSWDPKSSGVFVPYTGASADVDLGVHVLTAGGGDFNASFGPEKITNGTFASDISSWAGTDWAWSSDYGGCAYSASNNAFSQYIAGIGLWDALLSFDANFSISGPYDYATVRVRITNGTYTTDLRFQVGDAVPGLQHFSYRCSTYLNTTLSFMVEDPIAGGTLFLDNISLKAYTASADIDVDGAIVATNSITAKKFYATEGGFLQVLTPSGLTEARTITMPDASGTLAVSATAPITLSALGDLGHSTSAGYIHLPTAGSANQILKNSGTAGTGAWGTVTENAGALAAITTLDMSGALTNTLATGNAPLVISSTTKCTNLNVDLLDDKHVGTSGNTIPLLDGTNTWSGTQKINVNSTTAFIVEQDGVKDNVFIVDTTNGRVGINGAPSAYELQLPTATQTGRIQCSNLGCGTAPTTNILLGIGNSADAVLTQGIACNPSFSITNSSIYAMHATPSIAGTPTAARTAYGIYFGSNAANGDGAYNQIFYGAQFCSYIVQAAPFTLWNAGKNHTICGGQFVAGAQKYFGSDIASNVNCYSGWFLPPINNCTGTARSFSIVCDGDMAIKSNAKVYLEGGGGSAGSSHVIGDSYFVFNSSTTDIDFYVDAVKVLNLDDDVAQSCVPFKIGAGAAGIDYTLTFDGESADGVISWMEDEDYFKFSDDILMNATEHIYFNDTSSHIYDDGTDLMLTSNGKVRTGGSFQANDYYSGDGTQGITGTFYALDDSANVATVVVKDGLITQWEVL